jgi:general secretion pathway protein K
MSVTMNVAKPGERGMILVVVLWVVAMMTAIIVSLSAFTQKNLSLAGVETGQLRNEELLLSGLEVAKAAILATLADDRVFIDASPRRIDLGNGSGFELKIQDTSGLIDLNRAPLALLQSLAEQVGAGQSDTSTVLKEVIRQRNVKETDAGSKEKTDQPVVKPAIFAASGELFALPGSNAAAVTELLRITTLFTADGKLNPLSAPNEVLRAVPGLKPEDKAIFDAARQQKQWKQPRVQNALQKYADVLAIRESRIFNVEVTVIAAKEGPTGQKLATTIILDQAADVPFQTLSLSW